MSKELKTTIGLEIHVQLKTKSKMFCRCDNNAEGKAPNTVVCPVCLGLPGALPVANEEAVKWTIKTGLAIGSTIPHIAKFDRKHYFYPDLPKGYQISQYDEPFCLGGELVVDGQPVIFNRIHLEEDAGKLIHSGGKSLVDLNRAGTPLMEMVTEPVITSPKQAGDFLRRLQKLVRDEARVSDADMEKGHMRCDANISVTDGEQMSEIVEIKNVNSFRFVEKALAIEEARLKGEYSSWPKTKKKVTRGYDSTTNTTYVQREKEEAADYRYFPEPDLPPVDTTKFDLEALKAELADTLEMKIDSLTVIGVSEADAKSVVESREKWQSFQALKGLCEEKCLPVLVKALVHNYFGFLPEIDEKAPEYAAALQALANDAISKTQFTGLVQSIKEGRGTFDSLSQELVLGDDSALRDTIAKVIADNPKEVERYKLGQVQLFGFFVGQVMKASGGKANPKSVNEMLRDELGK